MPRSRCPASSAAWTQAASPTSAVSRRRVGSARARWRGCSRRARAPRSTRASRGPDAIYASGAGPQSKSLRPLQTVQPLAALTGQTVRTQFGKGQEAALVAALLAEPGAALVSWQHERATAIAAALAPGLAGVPQGWPDARFDVVWVFDRHGGGWAFSQVCQLLLAGDRDHAVA